MKYTFNIGLGLSAYELASFKLLIDTTELHSLYQFNDLDLHSRSQGTEKTRFCTIIVLQVAWISPNFRNSW